MKILALVGAIAVGGFVGTVTDVRIKSTKIPVFIMLIGLGIIYSCFPPAAYGLSDAPPERTLIIPTYGLVITLLIFGFSLGQLFQQISLTYPIFSVSSLILILFVAVLSINETISTSQKYINYAASWRQFNEQMLTYQKVGATNVVISTQEMNANNWSKLDVLGDNPKFWLNKCISDYYGVNVTSNSPIP